MAPVAAVANPGLSSREDARRVMSSSMLDDMFANQPILSSSRDNDTHLDEGMYPSLTSQPVSYTPHSDHSMVSSEHYPDANLFPTNDHSFSPENNELAAIASHHRAVAALAPAAERPSTKSISASPSSNTDSTAADPDSRKRKRERNTEAARRYRQRRVDQVDELQIALSTMTNERDALKAELSAARAEAALLKEMMRSNMGSHEGRQEDKKSSGKR